MKAEVLRKESDLRARAPRAERRTENRARAAGRIDQAEQQLERRRLARAVRPEETEHLAAPDRERQIRNRNGAVEMLAQRLGLDREIGHP